jgi:phosphate transport system protein
VPRERLQAQIDDLRAEVLALSETVRDRLEAGITAVETRDARLGRTVADGDADVDAHSLSIERDCVDVLALQQPVASDLRLVVASFKIVTDLERIGDIAANLGQYAMAADHDHHPAVDVGQIGAVAVEMVDEAAEAYATDDPALARAVAGRDDYLDDLCDRASRTVTAGLLAADVPAADTEAVLDDVRRLLLTVRDLERAGDHAVNVAARTLYAVEHSDDLI